MSLAEPGYNNRLSIRDFVDSNAKSHGDKTYLIDPETGEETSFAHCQSEVHRIATQIHAYGIKPGETVAFAAANSSQTAMVILGLLYGGYIATAINLVAGESTIAYVLEHSETRLIIADDNSEKMLSPILSDMHQAPELILMATISKGASGSVSQEKCSDISAELDGLLMYTSGTTGRPKGVILTQNNLIAGGSSVATAHQLKPADRGLCVLPFYHINAFCVSLIGSLVSRSSLVIPTKFSVSSFWHSVRENNCTWFSVVPTQISYLLHNADKPGCDATGCESLRFGRSASAPLSPDMHQAFESRFKVPIIETMGLTETAAQILSNPLPPETRKTGSPGIAFCNEVMIGDSQQKEVERGTEGEILVRGKNVLRCYLKNEEATGQTITPDRWLRTGDLGRMDSDGYVYVTGRLKELIIKGGENIAPREVDEALYAHPGVVEAAAFAVDCNDYGQRVQAGVRISEGASISEEELISLCVRKLGAFKSPDRVYFLPELPKGPSGKIQRIKLAEQVSAGL
ncbi:MAG: AMP-binding protein [Pseudomonadota bacterium]